MQNHSTSNLMYKINLTDILYLERKDDSMYLDFCHRCEHRWLPCIQTIFSPYFFLSAYFKRNICRKKVFTNNTRLSHGSSILAENWFKYSASICAAVWRYAYEPKHCFDLLKFNNKKYKNTFGKCWWVKMFAFDNNLGLGAHQLPRVHVVRSHRTDVVQQDKEGAWNSTIYGNSGGSGFDIVCLSIFLNF